MAYALSVKPSILPAGDNASGVGRNFSRQSLYSNHYFYYSIAEKILSSLIDRFTSKRRYAVRFSRNHLVR